MWQSMKNVVSESTGKAVQLVADNPEKATYIIAGLSVALLVVLFIR